jgi:ABC-2 type transport system permease protein
METLRIYLKLVRISMKARMQYRADFLVGVLSIIFINAMSIGSISVVVHRFVHLNGWSVWEMVFLYNLYLIGHSVFSLFFWHFTSMDDYIVKGTFDQFLVRPLSPLVQLLGREIQYLGFGDVIVAVLGLGISYHYLGLDWGVWQWLYLLLIVFSGALIETAIFWLFACIAFWSGRSQSTFWVVWEVSTMVQQYPIDLFGKWFRVLVTGFIPMAFMNFYPAIYLLGKQADYPQYGWILYAAPFVAAGLLLLAYTVWRQALGRYMSSGN